MAQAASYYGTTPRASATAGAQAPARMPAYEQPLTALFVVSTLAYLGIYAVEAPIRFVLLWAGKDQFILARDLLIFGPLLALLVTQAMRLRIHPAFLVAGVLLAFHGLVLIGTVHSWLGAVYGVKIVINILFGFFAASALLYPNDGALKTLALIWCVILVGVFLDKFGVTFPWAGMKTIVGDINVDVSKDWQISDPLSRRVAGFTRSSIAVACIVPPLAIILINRLRNSFVRWMIALLSVAAVAFTTQKGAIIAFAPLVVILFLPINTRVRMLRFMCIVFIVLAIALPLFTLNVKFSHGSGVFSTESLWLRIAYTWPQALEWIERHGVFPFGVGLGGIGGPQRFYAPDNFNPADNVMILLYAYFGLFALLYVIFAARLAMRPIVGEVSHVIPAIAILAFCFGYGAVLSMIEDQSAALFIGAALGVLWQHTGRAPFPTWRTNPAFLERRPWKPVRTI